MGDQSKKLTKKEVLNIVRKRGVILMDLVEWQDDKDVVLVAGKSFPLALEYASDKLKKDKDVVMAAITREPRALSLAAKEIYDDDYFREVAFNISKSAFIVDPEAFEEFEFQDIVMMRRVFRTKLNKGPDGKKYRTREDYEKAVEQHPFFKKFIRYYRRDNVPVSAFEIRQFEAELLKMKKNRLKVKAKAEARKKEATLQSTLG